MVYNGSSHQNTDFIFLKHDLNTLTSKGRSDRGL